MKKYRYTIMTCVTNNFEPFRNISEKYADVEYVYITDCPDIKSDVWTVVTDTRFTHLSPFDLVFYARWHPFEYAHSDVVVWVDGSMDIISPTIDDLASALKNDTTVDAVFNLHPSRRNLFDEYAIWCKWRNYSETDAFKCLHFMQSHNYDFNNNLLFQTGFHIRKNTAMCNDINMRCYDLCKRFGHNGCVDRLDQTLATYVIASYPSNKYKVIYDTKPYVVIHPHGAV